MFMINYYLTTTTTGLFVVWLAFADSVFRKSRGYYYYYDYCVVIVAIIVIMLLLLLLRDAVLLLTKNIFRCLNFHCWDGTVVIIVIIIIVALL